MKINKKYIGTLLAVALTYSHAYASSVFMLQFGSYQSAEEAQARLDEVKAKHAGALSRLESSVRPVTLPPDNLVVYRTQAGPLATRADAQSICSQLISNGDSCYIVETAVSTGKLAPAPTSSLEKEPAQAAAQSVVMSEPAMRDATNVAALNTVAASPSVTIAPETPSNTQESVGSALDSAASKQHATEQASISNTTPTNRPHRSFWERINPFASNTPSETAPAAVAVVDADQAQAAAPVDVVEYSPSLPAISPSTLAPTVATSDNIAGKDTSVSVPKASTMPPPTVIVPSATPIDGVATKNTAVIVPSVRTAPAPLVSRDMGVIQPPSSATTAARPVLQAETFVLPPPPAPLNANAKTFSTTSSAVSSAEPIASSPLPLPTGTLPNVRVEEAKHVPVSSSTTIAPVMAASAPAAIVTNPLPAVNLSPSATLGQRTIWAQMGQFSTPQDALAFWNHYRQSHPDFPVVRVRVTTPVVAQRHDLPLVNLRVGPFAKQEFVNNLCASLVPQQGMTCGAIADMGVAVNPYSSANTASRYKR